MCLQKSEILHAFSKINILMTLAEGGAVSTRHLLQLCKLNPYLCMIMRWEVSGSPSQVEKQVCVECIKVIISLKSQLMEELKGLRWWKVIPNSWKEITLKEEGFPSWLRYSQSMGKLEPACFEQLQSKRDVQSFFSVIWEQNFQPHPHTTTPSLHSHHCSIYEHSR